MEMELHELLALWRAIYAPGAAGYTLRRGASTNYACPAEGGEETEEHT